MEAMDKSTKKTVAQMDGKLIAPVDDDENIFIDCKRYNAACKARSDAILYRDTARRELILKAFRKAVAEFEREYGFSPTHALLSYDDRTTIETANQVEFRAINGFGADYMVVDGIKICGGCNQEAGDIQLRKSSEGE
jgi:hypothetical protein